MRKELMMARGECKAELVLKNGNILNVFTEEIRVGDVAISGGRIIGVGTYEGMKELDCTGKYMVPGFIDAHMHMESTMVTPLELSKVLVKKGTTTVIADPHELVNVKGNAAMEYILDATDSLPLNAYIMLPSAVPVTEHESNGAGEFSAEDMRRYIDHKRVLGLGEVMNVEEVISGAPKMHEKLKVCKGKVMDGHAPGIRGRDLEAYRLAGIDNDHECSSALEAIQKIRAGFHIFIREGSGAKNLDTIISGLLNEGISFERCMFCTDDKHLEDIVTEGHINYCVKRAISLGVPAGAAYKMASYNTAQVYGLRYLGAVAAGYQADILILKDLENPSPSLVIQKGTIITEDYLNGFTYEIKNPDLCKTVEIGKITTKDLNLKVNEKNHVIQMLRHQLITKGLYERIPEDGGFFAPNKEYNKLCVIERYGRNQLIGTAPLKGFGIMNGALAASISHDSHNIIAAGDNDADILTAVNCLQKMQGGIAIVSNGVLRGELALPVCGLISLKTADEVQQIVKELLITARALGVNEDVDPFITLSFMALTVIPEIRLTERGLFYHGNILQEADEKEMKKFNKIIGC